MCIRDRLYVLGVFGLIETNKRNESGKGRIKLSGVLSKNNKLNEHESCYSFIFATLDTKKLKINRFL